MKSQKWEQRDRKQKNNTLKRKFWRRSGSQIKNKKREKSMKELELEDYHY